MGIHEQLQVSVSFLIHSHQGSFYSKARNFSIHHTQQKMIQLLMELIK
jgi:hypothetical protein